MFCVMVILLLVISSADPRSMLTIRLTNQNTLVRDAIHSFMKGTRSKLPCGHSDKWFVDGEKRVMQIVGTDLQNKFLNDTANMLPEGDFEALLVEHQSLGFIDGSRRWTHELHVAYSMQRQRIIDFTVQRVQVNAARMMRIMLA